MEALSVLYACDDNYAPFCGVSILSLLKNNTDIEKIRLFVVADNISDENREKLERTAHSFSRELFLIDAQKVRDLMEELGVPKYRGSYATHYRKFFQMLLPDDVEHVLYMDSDTVVPGKLSRLLTFDMKRKCIGVVRDALGGRYRKLLGFVDGDLYFNAGVTWIDVDAWKRRRYSERMMDHITHVRAKYCNPDQDLFNLVLKGDTVLLPISYNFQPIHRAYSDRSYFANYPRDYYSKEEIEAARENPIILHTYRFLGEFPWHKGNLHPDNAIFDEYLRQSEWKDYVKKEAPLDVMFKTEKIMYRCMPRALFLWIFQKVMYWSFYWKNQSLLKQEATKQGGVNR